MSETPTLLLVNAAPTPASSQPIPVHPVSLDAVAPQPVAHPGTVPQQAAVPPQAAVPLGAAPPVPAAEKKGFFQRVQQFVDDHPVAAAATVAAVAGVGLGQRMERNAGYPQQQGQQQGRQQAPQQGNHGPNFGRSR